MTSWIKYSLVVEDPDTTNLVSDLLLNIGAEYVALENKEDEAIFEPKPGETPLWQKTTLTALFKSEYFNLLFIRFQLKVLFDHIFQDQVSHILEENLVPLSFSKHTIVINDRLKICQDISSSIDENTTQIILEPGLAFGTGEHPTTQLCLDWISHNNLKGQSIIDYGCGSGILAIAASKFGATQVWACDIDDQALTATRMNIGKNNLTYQNIMVCHPDECTFKVNIIIANILLNTLIELIGTFHTLLIPKGKLVMSGILIDQIHDIKNKLSPLFQFTSSRVKNNWALVEVTRYN